MLIIDVVAKNIDGNLTCSEVSELLADQQNSGGVSHLHMHARDGFATYATPMFRLNSSGERVQYEEAHMTSPERVERAGVVPVMTPGAKPPKSNFALSRNMMAKAEPGPSARSKYDYRSNQPEIAESAERGILVPMVLKVIPKAKPAPVDISDELAPIPVIGLDGTDPGRRNTVVNRLGVDRYATKKEGSFVGAMGTEVPKVQYVYQQQHAKVPRLPGSEKHTMFEDSESMVMYLTAALRSTAALHMLVNLLDKKPGDATTVGVFSKTAVWQVAQHVRNKGAKAKSPPPEPKVIERVTNVDPSIARTAANPNPVLDTFTYASKPIDHVVLVMGRRADGALNIVTLFPSPDTTLATIGVSNAPNLDIEEPVFMGAKTATPMDKNHKPLRW